MRIATIYDFCARRRYRPASGTSSPVGFKNGTDGSVTVAIDAMRAASCPHAFVRFFPIARQPLYLIPAQMGINEMGLASIVKTSGNPYVHLILRGSSHGPNFSSDHIEKALASIDKAGAKQRGIMVDCSHGNSLKDHKRQPGVLADLSQQIASGQDGITGIMIESFINAGRQNIPAEGPSGLKHGVSMCVAPCLPPFWVGAHFWLSTDGCVDWDTTVQMLDGLNEVRSLPSRKSALFTILAHRQ